MNAYHERLGQSIRSAQLHIRALKRTTPHIFPEWQRLQTAKAEVQRANEQLAHAKKAWQLLGGKDPS